MSPKYKEVCSKNKIKKDQENSLTDFEGKIHIFSPKKKETPFCASVSASFTVEAAVSVPVVLCFFLTLLYLFYVMRVQMQVQSALNETGRTLSEYACLENGEERGGWVVGLALSKSLLTGKLKEQGLADSCIKGGISGIRLGKSKFDGDYIELHVSYQMQIPTGMFGEITLPVKQRVKTRKWTGKRVDNCETDETWVYLTENGSVYHMTKQCPYLDLTIHKLSAREVAGERNKSGGKYRACERCEEKGGFYVYITDYGDAYHSNLDCGGLKRSVSRVRLSEVAGKHACSKCGGER